jgi:hypothetical protein
MTRLLPVEKNALAPQINDKSEPLGLWPSRTGCLSVILTLVRCARGAHHAGALQ